MLSWLAGNEEDYWHNAKKVEQGRQKPRKGRKLKARVSGWSEGNEGRNGELTEVWMKKYKRAKNLINVGEVSKAMAAILSDGVAKVDSQVLSQLRTKHPTRSAPVVIPSMEVIEAERATWLEDLHIVEDADEVDSKLELIPENSKN